MKALNFSLQTCIRHFCLDLCIVQELFAFFNKRSEHCLGKKKKEKKNKNLFEKLSKFLRA
jgi:hypothetical protein